jgi:hypothetical protein
LRYSQSEPALKSAQKPALPKESKKFGAGQKLIAPKERHISAKCVNQIIHVFHDLNISPEHLIRTLKAAG